MHIFGPLKLFSVLITVMWSTFLFFFFVPDFQFSVSLFSPPTHSPLPFRYHPYIPPPPPPQKKYTATMCALVSIFSIPSTTQVHPRWYTWVDCYLMKVSHVHNQACPRAMLTYLWSLMQYHRQTWKWILTVVMWLWADNLVFLSQDQQDPVHLVVKQPVWSAEGHNLDYL